MHDSVGLKVHNKVFKACNIDNQIAYHLGNVSSSFMIIDAVRLLSTRIHEGSELDTCLELVQYF